MPVGGIIVARVFDGACNIEGAEVIAAVDAEVAALDRTGGGAIGDREGRVGIAARDANEKGAGDFIVDAGCNARIMALLRGATRRALAIELSIPAEARRPEARAACNGATGSTRRPAGNSLACDPPLGDADRRLLRINVWMDHHTR